MITDLFNNQAVGEPTDGLGEREVRQRHSDLPFLLPCQLFPTPPS